MTSHFRRAIRLAACLVLVGVMLTATPWAAAAHADPSRDDVFRALQVDEVRADYVILIDTSGSMNADSLYLDVRTTLRAFLGGLAPRDHVSIYTFADGPTPQYVGPAGDPDRILAAVPTAPTSAGRTDIGAAISSALGELERPDAATVASVVLLTDGLHEPPAGSPYPTTSGQPWVELTQRASRLKAHVTGYALSLRGQTGAGLLGTVITPTTVLDPTSIGQLSEYLDRAKAGTRTEKARAALAGDLGQGVTASWTVSDEVDLTSGTAPLRLTLRATTSKAPLLISDLRIASDQGSTLSGALPSTVEIPAGGERGFDLTLSWRPAPGFIPFRKDRQIRPTLTAAGQVSSPWQTALRPDIDLRVPSTIANPTRVVSAAVVVGTWRAQLVAAGIALVLILILWAVVYRRRRAPQSGTLVATGGDGRELGRFRLRGRSTRVRSTALPGSGRVVARPTRPRFDNVAGVEYTITYESSGHRSRGTFRPGGSTLVNGVNFQHSDPGITPANDEAVTAALPMPMPVPVVPLPPRSIE